MDLLATWRTLPRTGLGLIRIQGADAVSFLQGQLSNDMTRLASGQLLLAGYHNPHGRTIALLWLLQRAQDDLLALLPQELAAPVAARLSRFVLRTKVKVSAESAAAPEFATTLDAARIGIQPTAPNDWRLASIEAGMPQVYAATSEAFVAQMLNLDLAGGVSFEKGCYTGQEVIARAHYRGRVKRRMQRFVSESPASLQAGDSGVFADGRTFKVVDAAVRADGRCEFLAVAPLAPSAPGETADAGTDEPAATADRQPLAVQALPLPYALPE